MFDLRRFMGSIAVAAVAGCVSSEPVGGTPDESAGGDGRTGSATDTEAASDTSANEVCDVDGPAIVTWQWNFGDHLPVGEPGASAYAEDSLAVFDCDVTGGDGDEAAMDLELACASEGADVGAMQIALSPVPMGVVEALATDVPMSLAYRPGNDCPNGCSAVGGWLALRSAADGELLLGIVDVHRELAPVAALLQPIGISVEPRACEPVEIVECEDPEDGKLRALDVTVTADQESVTLQAGEQAELGPFEVVLDRASLGTLNCVDDGGDPSALRLLVGRRALP